MLKYLPNGLSALRLVAAPLAAWAILSGHDSAAFIIFVFAGLSDLADGFIARHWHSTSRVGAWLDPLADKLLMLFCFVALLRVGAVALWLVALVVARDAVIVLGALSTKLLHLPMRIAPLSIGKATTAVEVIYVGMLLLLLAFGREAPLLVLAGSFAVALFAALSTVIYAQFFLRSLFFGGRTA
jgi:cardiolipin synthase (CMP-forming)